MQLFYYPDAALGELTLNETESRHCVRVLRLTEGDEVNITDGKGGMFTAVIVDANPKGCSLDVTTVVREWEKRPYTLTIGVAPPKNPERFEWFLEKATEVGIDHVIPLLCSRSERKILKTERENKVITSAVKQSLKAYHPHLEELTEFKKAVMQPFCGVKLIAHCDTDIAARIPLKQCISKGGNVLILIGPEGDFSKEEINFALENGFTAVTLGTARLRTETAALAAVMYTAFINS